MSKIKIANIRGPKGDPGDTTAAEALATQAAESASVAQQLAEDIAHATGNAFESAGVAHAEAVIATQMRDQAAQAVSDAQIVAADNLLAVQTITSDNLLAVQLAKDEAVASKNAAKGSEDAAKESEDAALISKNAAKASEDASGANAVSALASKNAAKASEDASGANAVSALASKNAAKGSEDAARVSQNAAKGSEDAALVSKNAAGVSEGNAAGSAAAAAATLAGAVPKSLIDAKGDLIVGSANDTVARLPAAANGSVLVTDSAQASGLKYEGPTVFPRTTAQTLSTAEKTQALANLGIAPGTTVGAMPYVADVNGSIKTQPVVPLLKNMLANSDFSNGTTGWTGNSGAITATGGVITHTANGTNAGPGVTGGAMPTPTVIGNTYYVAVRSRSNGPATAFRTFDGATTLNLSGTVAQGVYAVRSLTYVARAALTASYFYHYYASAEAALNQTMDIDWTILIDLTATFGAGFEPSKDEMDKLMAQWGGWFADTDPKLLPSYVWAKRTQNAATNLVTNGGFGNGTTGWLASDSSYTASGGVLTATPTARYGGVRYPLESAPYRKMYISASIQSTDPLTRLYLSDSTYFTTIVGTHSGGGAYELLSGVVSFSEVYSPSLALRIRSDAATGWTAFNVKNVLALNLTTTFGVGLEPTKSEMDVLLSRYPNSWFNGTVNDLVKDFDKWNRRGTGSPEGVVAASPGVKWTDTANTNGAREWRKDAGTGNTGWVVTVGDTADRVLGNADLSNGWTTGVGETRLRRVNNVVYLTSGSGGVNPASSTGVQFIALPVGFRPAGLPNFAAIGSGFETGSETTRKIVKSFGSLQCSTAAATITFVISWTTVDAWPTTLPGS